MLLMHKDSIMDKKDVVSILDFLRNVTYDPEALLKV
jgi:hypothetical protein